MQKVSNIKIGKYGITNSFIESLKNQFKNYESIRISVLKSFTRDRKKLKDYSEEIIEKLGKNYTSRIIGFTIAVKKWRKPIR